MYKLGLMQKWLILPLLAGLGGARPAAADDKPETVRVLVVAILATERNNQIHPKLKWIAPEVQKIDPKLTGFRLGKTTFKSIPVAKEETFPLVDNESVTVLVEHGADKNRRVGLRVTTTGVGEISYTTACGKCFPIITSYLTKDNERLIVAVMARPPHERRRDDKNGKDEGREKK